MTLLKTAGKKNACLLCRSGREEFLFEKEGKSFVRCPDCGFIYQKTLANADEARAYYEKTYYESFGERNAAILDARVNLYEDFLLKSAPYFRTGRLLDIGCGWGHFLKRAKRRGWEPWGIEPSREASESARRELGGPILNGTVESTELPENYFDVITLWNVVDCLPDPVEAIGKIRRWLVR